MVNHKSRVRWTEVLIDDCSARRAEALALLGPNIAVRKAAPLHARTSGSEEHALADVSIFFTTSSDAAPPRRAGGGERSAAKRFSTLTCRRGPACGLTAGGCYTAEDDTDF